MVFLSYMLIRSIFPLFFRNWRRPPMKFLRSEFSTETFEAILQRHTSTISLSSSSLDIDYTKILRIQTGYYEQPASWKMSHLIGRGEDEIMVAIRDDNLYVAGFADQTGQWHAFPRFVNLIPGSIPLPIEDDYVSLLGVGGHTNIPRLTLGRESMLDAIHTLSNYQPSIDNKVLGKALATVVVTLTETVRLRNIREWVRQGWSKGTRLPDKVAEEVVHWRRLTCAVLISHKNNGQWWGSKEADELYWSLGVRRRDEAFDRLCIMIWPRGSCTEEVLDDQHIAKIELDMARRARRWPTRKTGMGS
jgi:hypothetical protein